MMPLSSAFPLTLTLTGSTAYTIADGSQSEKLLALGSVVINGETTGGLIALDRNPSPMMLGMSFLRQSRRALWLDSANAVLVHADAAGDVQNALQAIHQR